MLNITPQNTEYLNIKYYIVIGIIDYHIECHISITLFYYLILNLKVHNEVINFPNILTKLC